MQLRLVIVAIALSVQAVSVMEAAAQRSGAGGQAPPAGWGDTTRATLDLTLAGKHDEVIAIYEKWVARHPDFPEAHVMLAGAYESKARDLLVKRTAGDSAAATELFEKSAAQGRRAFDLGAHPDIIIRPLIDIYGPVGLNRPDEQERVIREIVKRYPGEPLAHSEFVGLLVAKGQPIDSALASARTALAKDTDARLEYAESLLQLAQRTPEPQRGRLLAEAERIIADARKGKSPGAKP